MAPKNTAPRGGGRGRATGRNDRGNHRGGGIRKRPGGKTTAIDTDGDRVMVDGAGTGARGRGAQRGDRRPGRGGNRGDIIQRALRAGHGNVIQSRITGNETFGASVRILGWKEHKAAKGKSDGGARMLLDFITKKAGNLQPKTPIRVKQSHVDGDWIILNASPEDAARVVMLNGYDFGGQKLVIQNIQPGVKYEEEKEELSEDAKETMNNIRLVLQERYVVDDKVLDLSSLGQNEKLVEMGFFKDTHTVGKLFPVMMVVCNEIFTKPEDKAEYVPSIILAGNAITNVSMVGELADTFPDLRNLDLTFNQIQDLRGLDIWRHKFRKLENLRLNGNPISDIPSDFKDKLMEWYPKLRFLNDIEVRSEGEIALAIDRAKAAENITPIPIGDWDFRDLADVAVKFLPEFIALYDSDRNALADRFYDDQSVHSISVNTGAPRRAEQKQEPVASWDAYIPKSRNLAKITHLPARMSRTHIGTVNIKEFWKGLPGSKHPDLQTEKEKWIVDCHRLPGLPVADPVNAAQNPLGVDGMIISLHGEFVEKDPLVPETRNIRSFSRTLILGPGRENNVRVISDIMAYRAHNLLPPISPPIAEQAPNDEILKKQELARKLSEATHMTLASAEVCLRESRWDLNEAYAYFTKHKHEIPADGWINGIPMLV